MTNNPSPDKTPKPSAPTNSQVEKVPVPPTDNKPAAASPTAASTPEKTTLSEADQRATETTKTQSSLPNLPIQPPKAVDAPPQESSPAPVTVAASSQAPEQLEQAKQAPDETIAHKPPTAVEAPKVTPIIPPIAQALPDIENPYLLAGEVDRARLVAQGRLFTAYIETHAKEFVGENLKHILDVGCSEGRITQVFARLYPNAEVVGIDKDGPAIEEAQRAAKDIRNLRFEVRDVTQGLPAGPFDLVYESLVFQHLHNMSQALKAAYDVLKPGGFLWMKDLDIHLDTVVDHPAYKRLAGWVVSVMDMAGQDWRITANLAPALNAVGLNLLRSEQELYPMGNLNVNGRITMAIHLGAYHNGRKAISRFLKVPESDIVDTYKEIVDAMLAPGGPSGNFKYVNTVSQRPATVASITAS